MQVALVDAHAVALQLAQQPALWAFFFQGVQQHIDCLIVRFALVADEYRGAFGFVDQAEALGGSPEIDIADLTDDTLNGLMARGFYLTGSDAYVGKSARISKDGPMEYTSSTVIANKETGERSGDNGYDIYGGGAYFLRLYRRSGYFPHHAFVQHGGECR